MMMKIVTRSDKYRKSFLLQRNRRGQVTAEKRRSRMILPCFYLAFLYNQFRIHGHSPPPLSSSPLLIPVGTFTPFPPTFQYAVEFKLKRIKNSFS